VLDGQLRPLLQAHDVDPPETRGPYDPERVELGRKLFFDKALSGNEDVACASCHHTRKGAETSDGLALGVGTGGEGSIPDRRTAEGREFEPRHSLGLFNLGFEGWRTQFWDGRVQRTASGELVNPKGDEMQEGLDGVIAVQAMLPVTSRIEMRGFPEDPNPISRIPDDRPRQIWSALMERLLDYEGYRELFRSAYPDKRLGEQSIKTTPRDTVLKLRSFEVTVPEGTPVNLLANIDLRTVLDRGALLKRLERLLTEPEQFAGLVEAMAQGQGGGGELRALVPALLALNQAPDFIEDHGHDSHYGDLTGAEKRALIEFMKTF
jgi:cytochrome c peroxidase